MKKLISIIVLVFTAVLLVGCDVQQFVVFYDTNGSSDQVESVRVLEGQYAPRPTQLIELEGFNFEYWTDVNGDEFHFEITPITSDTFVVAKWVEKEGTPEVPGEPEVPEVPGEPEEPEIPPVDGENPSNNDPNIINYYKSLEGLTGSAFNTKLRSIIKTTGRATGSTSQVKQADLYKGRNYNIYDGYGTYGNREHTWPKSKLGSGTPVDDLHNLRAAVVKTNSTRSNHPFGEGSGNWKLTNNKFYPGDEHVGDVARIILYIHVRYNISLSSVGNLEMFLKWHKQDPVNDFERSRNNNIQDIQNNRNPFIDYPEYVDFLLGSTSKLSVEDFIGFDYLYTDLAFTVGTDLVAFIDRKSLIVQ